MKKFIRTTICTMSAAMLIAGTGANAACLNSTIINRLKTGRSNIITQILNKSNHSNVSDKLKDIDFSEILNKLMSGGCAAQNGANNNNNSCPNGSCDDKNTACTNGSCDKKDPICPDGNCDKTDTNCPGGNCANNNTQNNNTKPSVNDNTQNNNQSAKKDTATVTMSEYASEVVRLVNQERAKNGLSALTVDAKVQAAAEVRAKEQATVFSHTRPNGTSCFTALQESGAKYNVAGENIAMGQTTPEQVMKDWMNSQGHRENILKSNFSRIGVGIYKDASGRLYWAQMFT